LVFDLVVVFFVVTAGVGSVAELAILTRLILRQKTTNTSSANVKTPAKIISPHGDAGVAELLGCGDCSPPTSSPVRYAADALEV
jgi:hypothetical protein